MKRLKTLLLTMLTLLTVSSISAAAINLDDAHIITKASNSPISGCSMSFDLNTSNGYTTYDAATTGDGTVTKAKVTAVVQRKVGSNWEDVSGTYEENTQSGRLATTGGRCYVASGYYYRLETVNTVWVGSKTYTETHHSQLEYY